jgi:exodeoxyribonuclease V alpha subunit
MARQFQSDVGGKMKELEWTTLDRHFASLVTGMATQPGGPIAVAALLASNAQGNGSSCVFLEEYAGTEVVDGSGRGVSLPSIDAWREAMLASGVVGTPGEWKPLILDAASRLYLRRYWEYEQRVAANLHQRLSQRSEPGEELRERLDGIFGKGVSGEVDWQKVAACKAVTQNLVVISGGPGTGKTRTLVAIIALLLEEAADDPLRIAIAAPTGKAAARVQESIRNAKATLACSDAIKERMPEEVTTLHRLLGRRRDSVSFRHNAENPLPIDVLIVDEASMIDLAMMAKVLDAAPANARVILLGDKDQLASIDTGYVLGDLCDASGALAEAHLVQLEKNYRFGAESGIGRLSRAINEGDAESARAVLDDGATDVRWRPLPAANRIAKTLGEQCIERCRGFIEAPTPEEALRRLGEFQILCAVREGPFGVRAINAAVEQTLVNAGVIASARPWFHGMPIMITRNDYGLGLFNGDVGLILRDAAGDGELRAFFPDASGVARRVLPSRLPAHEMAFAMTVHKSQGSEFGTVLTILPPVDVPILTRELLYTAVTRAREAVEIWGNEQVFATAIARRVQRRSGLRDALRVRGDLPEATDTPRPVAAASSQLQFEL